MSEKDKPKDEALEACWEIYRTMVVDYGKSRMEQEYNDASVTRAAGSLYHSAKGVDAALIKKAYRHEVVARYPEMPTPLDIAQRARSLQAAHDETMKELLASARAEAEVEIAAIKVEIRGQRDEATRYITELQQKAVKLEQDLAERMKADAPAEHAVVPLWVIALGGMSDEDLRVLLTLHALVDPKTSICYAKCKFIAERSGVAMPRVPTATKRLEDRGLLKRIKTAVGTHYCLHRPA